MKSHFFLGLFLDINFKNGATKDKIKILFAVSMQQQIISTRTRIGDFKKRKIEDTVENGEGVWFFISVSGVLLLWPGIYEDEEKKLLYSDKLSTPAIITMHRLDEFDKDVYKQYIPAAYLEDWETGVTVAFTHTWKDLLLKAVCDVDRQSTQAKIERNNKIVASSLKQSTQSFLAAALVHLNNSGIVLDESTHLGPFEETIKQVFAKDKISEQAVFDSFIKDPIEFCKEFFNGMINDKMDPLLSPLYGLSNTRFEAMSEMNYKETLAIIFNFITSLSGGKLLSTGYVND